MQDEDFVSRRMFFKKGASKMLPFLGLLTIPSLLMSCDPKDEPDKDYGGGSSSGCYGCSNTCSIACGNTCRSSAAYTPKSCSGSSCKAACKGSCKATCMKSCKAGSK